MHASPNLPLPLETLIYRTLDHWDDILVVLQRNGDGIADLIFRDVNRPFCNAAGYSETELKGRSLDVLIGPEADRARFAALTDAARDGRSAQLELPCTARSGRTVWIGMHLMPVPDAPGLFVVLGRDITEPMQARQRQAAIQGLLAKVFLTVDAAVAITGSDGVLLMTNPAADRLLGYPPNGLVGRNAAELVAPDAQALASAARDRQGLDGKDYTMTVPLLRADGVQIPARMHSVRIETPDGRQFRILTVHPPAAPAEAIDPPRSVLASRLSLAGLEAAKAALGTRWAATAQRAMAAAEQVIRRQLDPQDTAFRSTDSSFVVCFADTTEQVGAYRAAAIGRDIRHHLIGTGEPAGTVHLTVITAMVRVPAASDGARLAAFLNRELTARAGAIEETARTTLQATLASLRCERELIHSGTPDSPWGTFLSLPRTTEQQIRTAVAALPLAEAQALDLDAILLDLAAEQNAADGPASRGQNLLVEVNFDTFENRTNTDRYIGACRLLDARLRQRLVMVLTNMPPSTPRSRLLDCGMRLRPFCRTLGLALDRPEAAPCDLSLSGTALIVLDAAMLSRLPRAELATLLSRLQMGRSQLLVRRIASREAAAALLAMGVSLVSVQPG